MDRTGNDETQTFLEVLSVDDKMEDYRTFHYTPRGRKATGCPGNRWEVEDGTGRSPVS
jgi:hypothetical protein